MVYLEENSIVRFIKNAYLGGERTTDFYPPTAFYFSVAFGGSNRGPDAAFQEVSGIGTEVDTEKFHEGGENRFVHKLPTGVTHTDLTLTRGVASLDSELVGWCRDIMEGGFVMSIKPRNVIVNLLDSEGDPIRSWSFEAAFPIKWEVQAFNSTKNEVAVEKIILSYAYSTRMI